MKKSTTMLMKNGTRAFITFFIIAWGLWYLLSDPRGLIKSFSYPFVMYLAIMILVGLWQHLLFGNWPFAKMKQPYQGIVLTVLNVIFSFLLIHVVFYRIIGLGFNFFSQSNLNQAAAAGVLMPIEMMKELHLAESVIVSVVLTTFFFYPAIMILFKGWPTKPTDSQPEAGCNRLGWGFLICFFFFIIFIVPFWGATFSSKFGESLMVNNSPWWKNINGIGHLHWVFGWLEWAIVVLFMEANVWRGRFWSWLKLSQPWKGWISLIGTIGIGYILALICIRIISLWIPKETILHLQETNNLTKFLWYHSAEIAGFFLFPFLIWHHYFDDLTPFKDKDSKGAFIFRTLGVIVLAFIGYYIYYYLNFGSWGLGNHHMTEMSHRLTHGESLVWSFWVIIPLLFNEWFFHKWGFKSS
jgi:amino acid transporter, AAT family